MDGPDRRTVRRTRRHTPRGRIEGERVPDTYTFEGRMATSGMMLRGLRDRRPLPAAFRWTRWVWVAGLALPLLAAAVVLLR